jgi:hypothetical protein
MIAMTPPTSSSRFLLLPETRPDDEGAVRPKVRRYRLTRVGATGLPSGRSSGFEHLRRMHD